MVRLLLIAHAPLATAFRSVAAHTFPDTPVTAIDVSPADDPGAVEALARHHLGLDPACATLVLTDVFGATPANVAQRLAESGRVRVLSGLNVPMLWRALNYAELPLDDVAARSVAGGAQGVMSVALPRPQNQSLSPAHDPDQQHHHQQ
jgi:PTS system ascorbate-specific IIA component